MIAHLRGRVAARRAGSVVVDVGGVGYLVHLPGREHVPGRGEAIELHTSLQVREDSMTLYGFTDARALELFELLLSSSGVGPKLALAALGTHRPDALRQALADGDLATVTQVPGIGRKVAQRLLLELRDKLGGTDADLDVPGSGAAASPLADVREALLGLGYLPGEIADVVADLDPAGSPGDLLRTALKALGGPVPASAPAGRP